MSKIPSLQVRASNWNMRLPRTATPSKVTKVARERMPISKVDSSARQIEIFQVSKGQSVTTPLHLAAAKGEKQTILSRLKSGSLDFLVPDAAGKTAIFLAAEKGHKEIVSLLLVWHEKRGYPLTVMQIQTLKAILYSASK